MFALVCFLIMLPMIFSVPLLYVGMMPRVRQQSALLTMSIALMIAIACWLVFGNRLAFGFDLLHATTFSSLSAGLVQMDFYLYAVAMLMGTIAGNRNSRYMFGFVPVWTVLVYCPLAHWLWADHGWLRQLGALDFSGGIVVHLTAGLTSLVLAKALLPGDQPSMPNDFLTDYAATIIILVGLLGFNLAPAGSLNKLAGQVLINTFVAVLMAMIGWYWLTYRQNGVVQLGDLLNGVLCGLVTSTALVGYVGALSMAIVAAVAGVICRQMVSKMQHSKHFYDVVDSFAMNAVGGITGAVGLMIVQFFNGTHAIATAGKFAVVELLAVVVAAGLTVIGTMVAQLVAKACEAGVTRVMNLDSERLN